MQTKPKLRNLECKYSMDTSTKTSTPTSRHANELCLPAGHTEICAWGRRELRCWLSGTVIVVVSADFGRWKRYACGVDDNTVCSSPFISQAQQQCFRKRVCNFNMNPRLSSTSASCKKVSQYLSLTYVCVRGKEYNRDALHPRVFIVFVTYTCMLTTQYSFNIAVARQPSVSRFSFLL